MDRMNFASRLNAAQALQRRGEYDAAAEIFDEILAADPAQPDALVLSARLEAGRGRLQLAQSRLAAALAHNPNSGRAHADLGNVRRLSGDAAGAIESFKTALALDPGRAAAWNNFGLSLLAAGRAAEAGAAFGHALECEPRFAEALRNLVNTMSGLGQTAELRSQLEAIVARDKNNSEAHAALGFVELDCFAAPDRALIQFERARELGLHDAELFVNRGIALHDLGRIDEAVASYDAALVADPDYQLARFHRALAHLVDQRFDLAWDDYEARLVSPVVPPRQFHFPQWDGEDLAGRTLLILAEQGLGDEIMFASCFAETISRARQCVIDCSPKLAAIFKRSFPQATVHGGTQFDDPAWLAEIPPPDVQIRAGSLPRLLRPRLSAFPRHHGYLVADPQKVQRWRNWLAELGDGPKVGVSWRGGTAQSRAGQRSLKVDDLAPVFAVPGVHFVSLQYDANREEIAAYCERSGRSLRYAAEVVADYDETAALVVALDLVVSVCTAIIHLAGALGRPAWVMAPWVPEWRYGIHGESMAWYPANRVLRQSAPGRWDELIARAAAELAELRAHS